MMGRPSGELATKVNIAIQQYLGHWMDEQKARAIKTDYGPETYAWVSEVYRAAVDMPVDWSVETYEAAVTRVPVLLARTYPWLDENSIQRLQNCFAYLWK